MATTEPALGDVPTVRTSRVRSRVMSGVTGSVSMLSLSALVALFALTTFTLVPAFFGWQPDVILSGSMAPAILPGDVVVSSPITRDQILPGRVVLVNNPIRPGELLMHRVESINEDGSLVMRGDANNTADSTPVQVADVRGLARIRVPMIGLPALWLRNHNYLPLVGCLAGLLIALWGATGIHRPRADGGMRAPEQQAPRASSCPPGGQAASAPAPGQ